MRRFLTVSMAVLMICQLAGPVLFSPDVDRSGRLDLRDAIIAVRGLTGIADEEQDLHSRLRQTVEVFRATSGETPFIETDHRNMVPAASIPGALGQVAVHSDPLPKFRFFHSEEHEFSHGFPETPTPPPKAA